MSYDSSDKRLGRKELIWCAASAVLVASVALVTYFPSLDLNFFAEDHAILGVAARLDFSQFLVRYLSFGTASFYRPVEGLLEWIQFHLFGNDAELYRAVALLTHLANCLLILALVHRVTKRWQVASVAASIYAGLPGMVSSFYWITVPERFVSFFYLLALLFWMQYLEERKKTAYLVAVFSSVLALFTKEIGFTLPIALYLADRWLVGKTARLHDLVRRYFPFLIVWPLYALMYLTRLGALTDAQYGGPYAGLGIGLHNLTNLIYYAAALAYPWGPAWPVSLVWLALAILLLGYGCLVRRSKPLAFLSIVMLLPVLPVLPFTFVGERYLYLSMVVPAILFALILGITKRLWKARRAGFVASSAAVALLLIANAEADAGAFDNMAGLTRELRAPVRQIFQQHPDFDRGTYAYFVNAPIPTDIVSGMFALRYAGKVDVGGTDYARLAGLRNYVSSYVFSYDESGRVTEQQVALKAHVVIDPVLPAQFDIPILLVDLEPVNPRVDTGQNLTILLYWQSSSVLDKDYTLFAHLLAPDGSVVASRDSQPRGGTLPTNRWKPGDLVVDWIVLPVQDVLPGADYRLELGWYYLPTMERSGVIDGAGHRRAESIVIAPFEIAPRALDQTSK